MKQLLKFTTYTLLAIITIACVKDDVTGSTDIDYQQQYLGNWDCNEKTGVNHPQFYNVVITKGATDNEIIITDLYTAGTSVIAIINGPTFTIAEQTTEGITIIGTGSANVDFQQISLQFTADNKGSGIDNVEALLIR